MDPFINVIKQRHDPHRTVVYHSLVVSYPHVFRLKLAFSPNPVDGYKIHLRDRSSSSLAPFHPSVAKTSALAIESRISPPLTLPCSLFKKSRQPPGRRSATVAGKIVEG